MPVSSLPGPSGAPKIPRNFGCRFGKILRIFAEAAGFSEQTLILFWGPVLLSVPKNTLISRAPRAQGVSGVGGEEGLRQHSSILALRGSEFCQILMEFVSSVSVGEPEGIRVDSKTEYSVASRLNSTSDLSFYSFLCLPGGLRRCRFRNRGFCCSSVSASPGRIPPV